MVEHLLSDLKKYEEDDGELVIILICQYPFFILKFYKDVQIYSEQSIITVLPSRKYE